MSAVDERPVVGAAVEGRRLRRQALVGEVVEEELLDLVRARRRPDRRGGGEVGRVAVVDEAHEVRRADHVEVEHRRDLRPLLRRQRGDVVLGAEQARLLGAEPDEADLVLRVHQPQLLGDLEDAGRARAVVVDAVAGADAVEVRADDDHLVRVAPARLGDHVLGRVGAGAPVDLEAGAQAGEAVVHAVGERRGGLDRGGHEGRLQAR